MIFGIGTDIAKIERFEKIADKLANKYFSKAEIEEIKLRKKNFISAVAKNFSAKEACVKAIGTGFRNGLYLRHIEVLHEENGRPYIKLYAKAAEYMQKNAGSYKIFLSISDDGEYVQSFVIIEKM